MEFRGRAADLDLLARQLGLVIEGTGATRGRAVIMTGRRLVGKSRLVQEFCDRSRVPYVVFQATRGRNAVAERADFAGALAQSALTGRRQAADHAGGSGAGGWQAPVRFRCPGCPLQKCRNRGGWSRALAPAPRAGPRSPLATRPLARTSVGRCGHHTRWLSDGPARVTPGVRAAARSGVALRNPAADSRP